MIRVKREFKDRLQNDCFIDLFCGIGGFHLALSAFGAKCVFASDIDNEARKIYQKNFGLCPQGDIRKIANIDIPRHDILCGGFPCQSFSVSGSQAGFDDEKVGKLFFEIVRIADFHKPKIIFLENVANLETHDNGKSLARILDELKAIDYRPFYHVLNALDFDIPQSRKRLYIIAFHNRLGIVDFYFPAPRKSSKRLRSVLVDENNIPDSYYVKREFSLRKGYENIKYSRENPYIRIGEIGKGRQGERIYSVDGCSTTLSATGGGIGGRTGLYLLDGRVRKLMPRECARLMGFPQRFVIAETDNQAYQQFGNSVVVDVLQHIIIQAIKLLAEAGHE